MKDDSLDIAGYSNEPEPVPLFAHECAGLYEDDDISGAMDVEESDTSNIRPHEHHEDFEDPTLERFPSNKDEIISTVRKVETGLNADQTSVEGVPPSPLFKSRHSSVTDNSSDHSEPNSPTSARGQQNLSLSSLPQQSSRERSLSATSLHCIAEDIEGDDSENPKSENIAATADPAQIVEKLVKPAKTADEKAADSTAQKPGSAETAEEVTKAVPNAKGGQVGETTAASDEIHPTVEVSDAAEEAPVETQPVAEQTTSAIDRSHHGEGAEGHQIIDSKADEIAPPVEKAETADEAIQVAKEAEGEATLTPQKPSLASLITVPSHSTKATTGLLSPVSDEDEAVVLRNGKAKAKNDESSRPGYLTPERAATPKPEEPGSPREPPPNAADPDPVPEYDVKNGILKSELVSALSEPRSPQIVVSRAEETQPDENLLPAPSLGENGFEESETNKNEEASQTISKPKDAGDIKIVLADENSKYHAEDSNGVGVPRAGETAECVEAAKDADSSQDAPTAREVETVPHVSKLQETSHHTVIAGTSSAFEDSQPGSLKKRSVAKPNPTDRTDTPNSITETHREAAKGGNWFSAFFRLIFIDLVGGFVSRLCGGRRKT